MKFFNIKNGFMLCVSLFMPGALWAMEEVPRTIDAEARKWIAIAWTRVYLERKHDSNLTTNFFRTDTHHSIDAKGDTLFNKLYDKDPEKLHSTANNPVSTNLKNQAEVRYSADVTMTKAELDEAGRVSGIVYKYSISQEVGDETTTLVAPTFLIIACNRVVASSSSEGYAEGVKTITVKGIDPFDLYLSTRIAPQGRDNF